MQERVENAAEKNEGAQGSPSCSLVEANQKLILPVTWMARGEFA
jgi:hypothetical protein